MTLLAGDEGTSPNAMVPWEERLLQSFTLID